MNIFATAEFHDFVLTFSADAQEKLVWFVLGGCFGVLAIVMPTLIREAFPKK